MNVLKCCVCASELSREPTITAKALALYDKDLPSPLDAGLGPVLSSRIEWSGDQDGDLYEAMADALEHLGPKT
jgi:hypothetical protein